MVRQNFWKSMQLLLVIVLLPLSPHVANAGPGGGTYYANSPSGGASGTPLRKFVDSLPGLGAANQNNLGQYIPIAIPDTTSYPGSDYYEIGLKEYTQKMHSDLPKATKLRGYYQINTTDPTVQNVTQYLGPLIIAKTYDPTKAPGVAGNGKPVRIKFTNNLPTGSAGNLFIPTDRELMGAGRGPAGNFPAQFGGVVPAFNNYSGYYTQNRETLHLHGGNTTWISDGTPHQWTVPVGELSTPYQKGLSAQDVPDMPATGQGELTFYWTNQQSSRLMFYHDHAYGITRLNVYVGEAAGYLLTDATEEALINNGTLPNICPGGATAVCEYRYGIPLIIQDKTFVPQNIDVQDAAWNFNVTSVSGPKYTQTSTPRDKTVYPWGAYGDLWFPHVYEANQDPASPDGANPFGRWDYGPWFWPPVNIDPKYAKLPDPSTTPEAFMDTPVINGTAYPYLTVEPKAYRFRILNASNDRALNLSLFYADPGDPSGKEVKMVTAAPNPNFPADWPTDGRDGGVPDPTLVGPNMVQIGNEGGFLRNPVVIPNRPIGYDYNRRNIVVLNTLYRALTLGPAERADIIVDFSSVAPGSNIILYNDGPAPTPAFDPRYDYYTGDVDQTISGGAPSTIRGFGPNTRTIMQFRVVQSSTGTPAAPFNVTALKTALPPAFDATQPTPIVPQTWFGAPSDLYARIQDYSFTIPVNDPVANPTGSAIPKLIPFQPKAIQELWDPWGRMNATLGVELPFTNNSIQTTVPMGYVDTPTEMFTDGQPQIWKITHNGVDTHPVHFHQFNVQVVNRVGWDGAIRPPDENELGWKETVRMNPLEDIVVALLPKAQVLPFALPNSSRPLDVTASTSTQISVYTNPFRNGNMPSLIQNTPKNLGHEYVWHCHILGHEENDFMRVMIFMISTTAPPSPTGLNTYTVGQTVPGDSNAPTAVSSYVNKYANQIVLQWTDGATPYNIVTNPTPSNTSLFMIESSIDGGATWQKHSLVSYLPEYPPIWTDTSVPQNVSIRYRVTAYNSYIPPGSPAGTAGSFSAPLLSAVVANTGTWPNATGVTLTPSKPTPHVVGTLVQFTAAGSVTPAPATPVAYEYRFWLSTNGGAKVMVQDWSTDDTWILPASTAVGNYVITADARTTPNNNTFAADGGYDARSTLTYNIIVPPIPPVTVSAPPPGIYTVAPVTVTLTATSQSPPETIYYTLDGSIPTTASTRYTGPIVLNADTTINYFAVDVNGTAEAFKSETWYIHNGDLVASVKINNGATVTKNPNVTLTLSAFDPTGVATMQFSNDGLQFTPEEPYVTTKAWTLETGKGDGLKTVYVKFRDKSLPTGFLYSPVTAQIVYDTTPPVTAPSPVPGEYVSGPISVTLTSNEASTIYYTTTTDGTTPPDPTTASTVYTLPIPVNINPGTTTNIKYFGIDTAGNVETVKTGAWTMHTPDLIGIVRINNGALSTRTSAVTLSGSAHDADGISSVEYSNDGVNYSTPEAYVNDALINKAWTLDGSEGLKTVYFRFTDVSSYKYVLFSTITLGAKDGLVPGTTSFLGSAVKALQMAIGLVQPSTLDLAHADVAPYINGASVPDNRIDLLDVSVILLRSLNLITNF